MRRVGPSLKARQHREAGLTLLELLIVIAILGVLAAVAGPPLLRYFSKAKSDVARLQLDQIDAAIDLFRLDVGRPPTQQETLAALIQRPSGLTKWRGPYLKKQATLVDPWGRQFLYRQPGRHGAYDLYSLGADNAEGGEGENRDVTNWQDKR